MSEREREPADIETGERMTALAGATADAIGHKLRGEHETAEGAGYSVPVAEVDALIAEWPEAPRTAAEQMLEQYGPPNEATPTKLFWYGNGPWKRTMVTRDVVVHNFPSPHSDFLTQWIDYAVPIGKADEITAFDGSCLIDRTAGEAAGRCDSEWANILTLNLMHDIVTGSKSVEEARNIYAENAAGHVIGRPARYAEQLQFAVAQGGTEDPDDSNIAGAMMRQTGGKVIDALTGSEGGTPSE